VPVTAPITKDVPVRAELEKTKKHAIFCQKRPFLAVKVLLCPADTTT
jgi:hypothetical protein